MGRSPTTRWGLLVLLALLLGASRAHGSPLSEAVSALLPTDVILLGEQHDAPEHQRLQEGFVVELAQRGQIAALAIEMAERGASTQGLAREAAEDQVRAALRWNEKAWDWARYAPVVMAAVRHAVPVLGANLERAAMGAAMADDALDAHLNPALMAQQRDRVRVGHCMLLPESRIAPMTRIQIARDAAMAGTIASAVRPGQTVLLVAGAAHVDAALGVPTHLAATLRRKVVIAVAGAEAAPQAYRADLLWPTPPVPLKDHCAELGRQLGPREPASP